MIYRFSFGANGDLSFCEHISQHAFSPVEVVGDRKKVVATQMCDVWVDRTVFTATINTEREICFYRSATNNAKGFSRREFEDLRDSTRPVRAKLNRTSLGYRVFGI